MNVFDYPDDKMISFARDVCGRLRTVYDVDIAIEIIKDAFQHYTIFDLQRITTNINYEVNRLPNPYQKQLKPYVMEMINLYNEFMQEVRKKKIYGLSIQNKKLWEEYWDCSSETLFYDVDTKNDSRLGIGKPAGKLFYRLVYGYAMFLAGKPGHPVGMPFPGGWKVKEQNGRILCPIRDKEKDLPQALCNFCPAIQDENCQ